MTSVVGSASSNSSRRASLSSSNEESPLIRSRSNSFDGSQSGIPSVNHIHFDPRAFNSPHGHVDSETKESASDIPHTSPLASGGSSSPMSACSSANSDPLVNNHGPHRRSSSASATDIEKERIAARFCDQFYGEACSIDIESMITNHKNKLEFVEKLKNAINDAKSSKNALFIEQIKEDIDYDKVLASYSGQVFNGTVPSWIDSVRNYNEQSAEVYARALLIKTKACGYLSAQQEAKNERDIKLSGTYIEETISLLEKLKLLKFKSRNERLSVEEEISLHNQFILLNNQINAHQKDVEEEALPSPLIQHIESGFFGTIIDYLISAIGATFAFVAGARILPFSIAMMAAIPFLLDMLGRLIKLITAYFKKKQKQRAHAAKPIKEQILYPLVNLLKNTMNTIPSTFDSNQMKQLLDQQEQRLTKVFKETFKEVKEEMQQQFRDELQKLKEGSEQPKNIAAAQGN